MLEPLVKKILASRVYDIAVETPVQNAPNISARLGHQVALKREDLQPVFSFKLRGAYNKMSRFGAKDRAKGVVAASAGNHAQGVALAAQKLGIKAHIVMGGNTPSIKVEAVRGLGAHIVFQGDTYQQAADHAAKLTKTRGYVLVHPYDDADVIAGQGTVGMEIINQHPDADAIFVPVGGGGLIAGIAAYVKYLRPETRIIGVEAEGSACLAAALKAGRRVRLPLDTLDVFADGVSVAQVGLAPFRIAKTHVDEVVTVSTDEICAAIKDVFDDTRSIAEPSGALAVAGLKKYAESHPRVTGKRYVAVVSGANVNFDRLRHISERAELGEHREAIFGVTIDEQRGSFRRFCRALGKRGVTEFNYRFASDDEAHVYVGLQIGPGETRQGVAEGLASGGLPGNRHDGQRSRQAACPAHGRRSRLRQEAGTALPFRVPGTAGCLVALPERPRKPLEHHPVPLPQPRRRLGTRTRGVRGADDRPRKPRHLSRSHWLPLLGRDGQPGGGTFPALTPQTAEGP